MTKAVLFTLAGVLAILLSLVMFWWALQTAWLGSFPGREAQPYGLWALLQLTVGIALVVAAVGAFRRARRVNPRKK